MAAADSGRQQRVLRWAAVFLVVTGVVVCWVVVGDEAAWVWAETSADSAEETTSELRQVVNRIRMVIIALASALGTLFLTIAAVRWLAANGEPGAIDGAVWLTEWLTGKPDLAKGTRASYAGHIRKYLLPHLGKIRLDRLTSSQVEAMFEAIEADNIHILECRESADAKVRASVKGKRVISLSTKHRIRATLRSALSEAMRSPEVPVVVNVASHVRLPSCPRKKPLVFTRQDGTGWHPSHVSDWFARIARAAGLPPITLHGLRHGAASMALAVGTDVKVVSAELGHSTIHFTQDTYQTVFPEVARAAAEATAALLRGIPAPVSDVVPVR